MFEELLVEDDLDDDEFEIADDEFVVVGLADDVLCELDEFEDDDVLVVEVDVLAEDEFLEPDVETPDVESECTFLLLPEETLAPPELPLYLLEFEPPALTAAEL